MKLSKLITKTSKTATSDEGSQGAQLLSRAGYVYKEMAGVYAYLPLGLRTLDKIKQIIREEMDAVGGQELNMTALQPRDIWEKSDRWDTSKIDVWFKTELTAGGEVGLAPTHEEPIAAMFRHFVKSYKDLPIYPYQFQIKFRNELRAKSGIMRGREFWMKDLYSLCTDKEQHDEFYERVSFAYTRVFERLGLGDRTYKTFASGGAFAKYSHEYQTLTELGEDTVYLHKDGELCINEEVFNDEILAEFGVSREDFTEHKAAEVGNIFTLGTRFSEAEGLQYTDADGKSNFVFMGSYGIGPSRVMGLLSEVFSTEKGLRWGKAVAPFQVSLVGMGAKGMARASEIYDELVSKGVEVLFDDREKASFGEKMADSELIGCPLRILIGDKTLDQGDKAEVVWQGLENERPEGLQDIMEISEAVRLA
jgi:prolyl-tRNA synthetase